MRFTLALITLTMLGCTVHSHSTHVENGGGQRDARPRRAHKAAAPRASNKVHTSGRRAATVADASPAEDARKRLSAPHEPAAAANRRHGPATLGHSRTGEPHSASATDKRKGEPSSDRHKPVASFEEPKHATSSPQRSARHTRHLPPESTPRAADTGGSVKQIEHRPVAGASKPKRSVARKSASQAPDSDHRKHGPSREITGSEARPAHDVGTARADRAPTPIKLDKAPLPGSKKTDEQNTESTDAAYKKLLRTRDERLPEDPKTAKLKEPDERVR